ncbi:MAG: sulfatase-like hydrolase/transferase [Candidatus Hodarchaeota archaeon]
MSKDEKPNVLFIFSDQQRADTCGCYGQKLVVTPNLDKIASEGVLFENAFTPQPVCGPARACIQTGNFATENGIYRNGLGLDAQPQNKDNTLPTWLSQNGYEVGYIGKWHLASNSGATDFDKGDMVTFRNIAIPEDRRGGYVDYWLGVNALEHSSHGYNGMKDESWGDGPFPKGFMFDGDGNKVEFEGYRVDAQTDFVLDYIKTRDGKKPWFLFVSYIEPHHQNDHGRYEGPGGSKERFAVKKEDVPGDLWGADWLNKGDWEENYPDYLGQCWSLDRNVGRMVSCLEERGMLDNTLIIYTSDHGSHFHTREGEYKRNCCDGCLHIPMIIKGPGFENGTRIKSQVSLLDLAPTILEAAGAPVPSHLRGYALQQLLEQDPPKGWREEIFSQISGPQVGRLIRTGKWKYSVRAPGLTSGPFSRSDLYVEEFLFDLENDLFERENLVNVLELEEVRSELSNRLKERMVKIGEKEPVIISSRYLPDPAVAMESGKFVIDERGAVCLNLQYFDVPISEILEELLGTPVSLRVGDKTVFGTMETTEEGGPITFNKPDGTSAQLKDLLTDLVDKDYHLIVLHALEEDKHQVKGFEPRYTIFLNPYQIFRDEDKGIHF